MKTELTIDTQSDKNNVIVTLKCSYRSDEYCDAEYLQEAMSAILKAMKEDIERGLENTRLCDNDKRRN